MTTDQTTIETPPRERKAKRWPWVIGIIVAFIFGVGIGAVGAGDNTDRTATTTDDSAEVTELQNQIADLEVERDEALDALALLGTEEEPAAEEEPEPVSDEPAEIGDTIVVEWGSGDSGTVTVADLEATTKPYDQYGSGPKYDRFLIFTVDVESQADGFDIDSGDFYVTLDNERYEEGDGNSWDAVDLDDMLSYVTLNTGERTSGLLVFDIPEGSGELHYAPNYGGGAIATWKF